MSEGGYTLAESLAALMMVGLAVGGVAAGMNALGQMQAAATRKIETGQAIRSLDLSLNRLLGGRGPFMSDAKGAFTGDQFGFSFDCKAPRSCTARIERSARGLRLDVTEGGVVSTRLARLADARFLYVGSSTVGPTWPPSFAAPQALRSVVLIGRDQHGETPLATARIWIEDSGVCNFDLSSQTCRRGDQ